MEHTIYTDDTLEYPPKVVKEYTSPYKILDLINIITFLALPIIILLIILLMPVLFIIIVIITRPNPSNKREKDSSIN